MVDKGEILEKYKLEIQKYTKEQNKLVKTLELKDTKNIKEIEKIGAIENIFIKNKIISGIIVCNKDFEILEQQYYQDFVKFPYIPGFRAYRELPAMLEAFNKLEEKPEIILIQGHGTLHPRLGLASHFSLAANVPSIGVSSKLILGEEDKQGYILIDKKKRGKSIKIKQGANPVYISPGNHISLDSAAELIESLIKPTHKMPEPLRLAKKYTREIRDELAIQE